MTDYGSYEGETFISYEIKNTFHGINMIIKVEKMDSTIEIVFIDFDELVLLTSKLANNREVIYETDDVGYSFNISGRELSVSQSISSLGVEIIVSMTLTEGETDLFMEHLHELVEAARHEFDEMM